MSGKTGKPPWRVLGLSLILFFPACSGFPEPTPPPVAPTGTLRVTVFSDLDRPLEEAEVTCRVDEPCPAEGVSLTPEGKGVFSIQLSPGTYLVEVASPGRAFSIEDGIVVESGRETFRECRLFPGEFVAGRVVDSAGSGLAGVEIECRSRAAAGSRSRLFRTFSDSGGAFFFDQLPPGLNDLEASSPSTIAARRRDVPAGTNNLVLRLRPGYALRGKVDLAVVPDLSDLELRWEREGRKGRASELVWEKDGVFLLTGLEPGIYSVQLYDSRLRSPWVAGLEALPPAEAEPVPIALSPGASISGRVHRAPGGEPLVWAFLTLTGPEDFRDYESTDEEGQYAFSPLEPGSYQLQVRLNCDPWGESRAQATVELAAEEEKTNVDFPLAVEAGPTLSGLVVDEEGLPLAGARILAEVREGADDRSGSSVSVGAVESGSSGTFSFRLEAAREGEFRLGAELDGYVKGWSEWFVPDGGPEVVIALNRGVGLQVEVTDREGAPLFPALVELSEDEYFFGEKTVTDVRGRARFEHLAPGECRVRASLNGYAPAEKKIELDPGRELSEAALALEPGRSLRVSVRKETGEPAPGVKVMLSGRGVSSWREDHVTDDRGACLFENLPRVHLTVKLFNVPGASPRLIGREDEEVVFVLKNTGSITGRLLGPDGEPAAKVSAFIRRVDGDVFDTLDALYASLLLFRLKPDQGGGVFLLAGLMEGEYDLTVSAPGLARRVLEGVKVVPGETVDLGEIVLKPGGKISGRVVAAEDGSPLRALVRLEIEEASVPFGYLLGQPSDFASDRGEYVLERVPAGTHRLIVSSGDYRRYERGGISLSSGEERELSPIRLQKMSSDELAAAQRGKSLVPSLGFRMDQEKPRGFDDGLAVGEVLPGSAAEAAGLEPGDVILRINGVGQAENLGKYMRGLLGRPGTRVRLTVIREDGSEEELEAEIGQWEYEKELGGFFGY